MQARVCVTNESFKPELGFQIRVSSQVYDLKLELQRKARVWVFQNELGFETRDSNRVRVSN